MSDPKTPEDQPEVDAAALFGEQTEGSAAPSLADAVAAAEPEERLHPVLSNEEVLAARAKARSNIEAQRRKAATTDLIKAEEERLAREEGLVTGDGVKDEMVTVTLDLAEHSARIVLSGTPYYHGHTYTVPRHVGDTLREIQSRGHNHQNDIEGKGLSERMRRPHLTMLNAKTAAVTNAPQMVA